MGFEMLHAWKRLEGSAGLDEVEIVCVMMPEAVRTAMEAEGVPRAWRADAGVEWAN